MIICPFNPTANDSPLHYSSFPSSPVQIASFSKRMTPFLEGCLFLLLGASVLWKGGKGLEATWLLAGLAFAVTFAYWWMHRSNDRKTDDVPLHLWFVLMLFVLWAVASFAFSSTQNYGLDELLRDVSLVFLLLWVARNMNGKSSAIFLSRFTAVLSITTLIACAIGIAVYVLQPVNRFVGTFYDFRFTTDYWPNAWGEYLLLAWPIATVWSKRFSVVLRSIILGSVLGCLLLSYSRGSMLVFVMQGFLWAGILVIQAWREGRVFQPQISPALRLFLLLCGTGLVAVLIFTGVNQIRARFHDVESVTAKATFTASEGSSSISERQDFWNQAFALSLQRPLFGWGPYSFRFVQPRLQAEVFATSDHPHNVFLKLAMERGWIASLLFAVILLVILLRSLVISLGFAREPAWASDALCALRLPALIAVSGVLAHNLIDYNLQFVGIVFPLWLLLSFLTVPRARLQKSNKCIRIFELMVAVILGCTLIIEGRTLLLSSFGRHAEVRSNVPEALLWYERASGEVFSRDMHLSRGALSMGQGDQTSANAAFEDYASVNNEDARLWVLKGELAVQSGDDASALEHYATALRLGKYNYLEPLEGTLRIFSSGEYLEEAAEQKDEFLEIFWKFGEAILHNAHFIALSQSVETFGRIGDLLQKAYPWEAASVKTFTQKVLEHAEEERAKSLSRRPGFLW